MPTAALTTNGWNLVASGMAVFLIGANVAFLAEFGGRLVTWFQVKIVAVVILLVYVALSLLFGNPAMWRVVVGIGALTLDVLAMCWMWASLGRLHGSDPTIPAPQVVKAEDEDAARA